MKKTTFDDYSVIFIDADTGAGRFRAADCRSVSCVWIGGRLFLPASDEQKRAFISASCGSVPNLYTQSEMDAAIAAASTTND